MGEDGSGPFGVPETLMRTLWRPRPRHLSGHHLAAGKVGSETLFNFLRNCGPIITDKNHRLGRHFECFCRMRSGNFVE